MKVTLNYNSIFHDLRQLTYRYGEARYAHDGSQSEVKDTAQFGDNESDKELVCRYCHTGVAKLRMILKGHINLLFVDSNDNLSQNSSWQFEIKDEIGDTQALADLMHWFVVRYAMCEWARAYQPNEVAQCKDDLEEVKDELDELLILSSWPVKTKRKKYGETYSVELITSESSVTPTPTPATITDKGGTMSGNTVTYNLSKLVGRTEVTQNYSIEMTSRYTLVAAEALQYQSNGYTIKANAESTYDVVITTNSSCMYAAFKIGQQTKFIATYDDSSVSLSLQ